MVLKDIRTVVQGGKEAYDEANSHFKPPPEGLQPVGDTGFYKTPDVVSPNDCDNYPDSPYCGGNPWSNKPFGIDVDWSVHPCGVTVSARGTLGYTKLPTHQFSYVSPLCRDQYDKNETEPNKPSQASGGVYTDIPPTNWPGNISDDTEVWVIAIQHQRLSSIEWRVQLVDFDLPLAEFVDPSNENRDYLPTGWNYPSQTVRRGQSLMKARYTVKLNNNVPGSIATVHGIRAAPLHLLEQDTSNKYGWDNPNVYFASNYEGWLMLAKGFLGEIKSLHVASYLWNPVGWNSNGFKWNGRAFDGRIAFGASLSWVEIVAVIPVQDPPKENRQVPPPRKRKCCMQCCSDGQQNQNQNDSLLRQILKEVKDVKKVVGFEEFPVKMPESLLDRDEGFIGNLIPNQPVQEPNIPRLIGRFIRYFDEILGQWEVPIEIKDTDPTTPGDQPKGVRLKNVAECLADMYALLFDNYIVSQQNLQVGAKGLIETGLTKQAVVQNYYALMCLIDFFGFKYKEVKANVPLSFKVSEEKFEDFMKNSEQEIRVFDYDPKDKTSPSYADDMLALKQAAAIIKAVHFRKIDHKGDIAAQLLDLVKTAANYTGKVNDGEVKPGGGKTNKDFDDFIEDAETEWSRQTGINTQTPYGRPYDQRPRITILNPDGGVSNPPSGGS